jgi:hypothetical protein
VSNQHFLGVGWHDPAGDALSMRPNPIRDRLNSDIAEYLARGGTINPATPSVQLRLERYGDRSANVRWAVAPPEVGEFRRGAESAKRKRAGK